MKYISMDLFRLFLLLSIKLSFAGQSNDTIFWQKEKKLDWSHYVERSGRSSIYGATSDCQIDVIPKVKTDTLRCTIRAMLIRKTSWVISNAKTSQLLMHEQGHFDIQEIYARKLRKKIKESLFAKGSFKANFDILYNELLKSLSIAHSQYDNETDYSRNQDTQDEWIRKISKKLEELKDFENTGVIVPIAK